MQAENYNLEFLVFACIRQYLSVVAGILFVFVASIFICFASSWLVLTSIVRVKTGASILCIALQHCAKLVVVAEMTIYKTNFTRRIVLNCTKSKSRFVFQSLVSCSSSDTCSSDSPSSPLFFLVSLVFLVFLVSARSLGSLQSITASGSFRRAERRP
jgi:hypothetical protein